MINKKILFFLIIVMFSTNYMVYGKSAKTFVQNDMLNKYNKEAGDIWLHRQEFNIKKITVSESGLDIIITNNISDDKKQLLKSLTNINVNIVLQETHDIDGINAKNLSFGSDSKILTLDDMSFLLNDMPYMQDDGILMIPIRDMFKTFEKIGDSKYSINWIEKSREIECVINTRKVLFSIDNKTIQINNEATKLLLYDMVNCEGTVYISLKDFIGTMGINYAMCQYDEFSKRYSIPFY